MKKRVKMSDYKNWVCRDEDCRHLVVSKERPESIHWTDGHVCFFVPEDEIENE